MEDPQQSRPRRGRPPHEHPPFPPAISNAVATWERSMRVRGLTEMTIKEHRYAVERFLREADIVGLDSVTEDLILGWLDGVNGKARRGRRGDGRAARVLYAKGLRSFFAYAVRTGAIEADPMAAVRPRRPATDEPDAYSADELIRILVAAAWRHPRRAWAMLACYSLGLRRAELLALEPDDLDFPGGRVYVASGKGKRPRVVRMGPVAREALEELARWSNGTVVGPLHPVRFSGWVSEAAADAGLPAHRRKAHMLRASAATKMLGAGIPISAVSRFLGHSSVAITSRYLAVTDEDRERAVAVL
jgi:integrase/recombinase XerC